MGSRPGAVPDRGPDRGPDRSPEISFVLPAHDEQALLPRTLAALRTAAETALVPRGLEWEVIVADDASTDRTAELARAAGARVVSVNKRQIAGTRNAGAAAARGDLLVFVDADTLVGHEVLTAALEALEAGAVGGGARTRFDDRVPRHMLALGLFIAWLMERLRFASGCFVFCRRADFEAVGGFDETLYASEEIRLSRALARRGRFVVLPLAVRTSGRKARTHSVRDLLALLWLCIRLGPRALTRREGLELWYGARRPDPGAERPSRATDAGG